ncbi:protein RRNAD1 isoform X2 [Cyclopterus lumpus]|uniref:protein RRNAD1 isoform X2 n=1 Tax=Cyclopterus lumpus TaxID=8103 RepID=UPI001485F4B8|nr:protein RRNAD1 isoform X2 [Cyclopterus lumpus]
METGGEVKDILRRGLCPSWRFVPPLTLWRSPESAGRSEAAAAVRCRPTSSWTTRVRARCWGTYSGSTSNPRNSTRSASWARFFFFFFKIQLVKQLCDQTDCSTVVDVGSGQGHLTRFLSFGLGLSVTAIEADHALVATASKFDGQLLCALEKEGQKENCSSLVPVSHSPPRHVVGWVNPNASWEAFIEQLSAAQLVNESPPTPSGPSKKSPRGSEQVQPPGSHAVETSSRPGSTEPESTEPGSTEPESTEPGSTEPESTEPESTEPESTEPKSTEPESTEPESTEPESTEPGSTEPESTEPESTEPESTEPESTSRRQLTKNEPEEASPDFVLTGLHACGDLSATLLRHFVNCPHVRGITSVACCYMKTTTKENPDPPGLADRDADPSEFGYPMSSWVGGLPGHRLSYKAREGACHAVEDYARRLREGSEALRTHCYRAALETFIADARPDLRRAGIQTIKKAHLLPFTEYARLGLARVGLPPGLPLDPEQVEAMLKQQNRVVVYFSLALLLAPAVETLVLLDRMIYLRENGVDSQLVPLFDPNVSPRNFVLVALKPRLL